MDTRHVMPIAALFDEDCGRNLNSSPQDTLREAAIILGVTSEREFLVYGKETLEAMAQGQPRKARVLRVGLDQETDELEKLIALIRAVKGHDDYQGRSAN